MDDIRKHINLIETALYIEDASDEEDEDEGEGDLYEPGDDPVADVIFKTWASVYPNVRIFIAGGDSEYDVHTKGAPVAAVWGAPNVGADDLGYRLSFSVNDSGNPESSDVFVSDAIAGEYKGITFKILHNVIKHTGIENLAIDDDVTGGVWMKMAQKMKIIYTNTKNRTDSNYDFRNPNKVMHNFFDGSETSEWVEVEGSVEGGWRPVEKKDVPESASKE